MSRGSDRLAGRIVAASPETDGGAVALPAGYGRRAPLRRPRLLALEIRRPRVELLSLLLLAGVLNLWGLGRNGWANAYYSAAVRSMSASWHNFLYASFDPSGVMTVDKPPLALWVQVAAVKLFGYHPLSMLVPQALMGMASVALVYDLTRRRFGRAGGFIAGLVLALTPITVAISRHNNPDALLVLCCVAAVWCVVRALEDGRTRWLVGAGVCVGLGFETKMAVALMVVPGIVAAWLWIAPRGRRAALRQLLAGGAAMVAAGGAWPLLVALTPAASRPWISGTSDNSILSLIFGYNGLGRLDGQAGGPGGAGPGGGAFGGSAGPLRLLNASLGGQDGWLLGFALLAGVAILLASRLARGDRRSGWLLVVGGGFMTTAGAFSFARGIFHPYYVALLAPFTAALVGAGAAQLAARGRAMRVLAPLALAAAAASELVVLHANPGQLAWLPPVLAGACGVAAVALLALRGRRARAAALGVALGLLLVAPASWAVQTLGHATSGTFPAGGPASASFGGGPGGGARRGFGGPPPGAFAGGPPGRFAGAPGTAAAGLPPFAAGGRASGTRVTGGGPFGGQDASLVQAVRYARRHGGGAIATASQSGAAAQIIASGSDVAGIGGFSGRESQVSVSWLAQQVRSGRIRWVLTGGGLTGPGFDSRVGSSKVLAAVAKACPVAFKGTTAGAGGASVLYDCGGRASEILAAGA